VDIIASKEMEIKKRRQYQNKRRKKNKLKCIKYLGGKCHDCGAIPTEGIDKIVVKDNTVYVPYYSFDFDHTEWKEKTFHISAFMRCSFKKLKKELDDSKCELVCRNCHMIRTTKMRRENKEFIESADYRNIKYKDEDEEIEVEEPDWIQAKL
tara:strand:- start:1444 stop:1899 length:456 start_codon:yes stop_codon:yes gene_type:complete